MKRRDFIQIATTTGLVAGLVRPAFAQPATLVPTAPLDLTPILGAARGAVDAARLGPGRYRRWLGAKATSRADGHSLNPYGCADAANILYSLAEFPADVDERAASVEALRSFQDSTDGLFHEATHHAFHVTAHCAAALELFEARPAHPLTAMHPYRAPGALEAFLDQLNWVGHPWNASHEGAGLYAALVLAGEADAAWEDRYFAWLATECDPASGFWRRGAVATAGTPTGRPLFHHLAGTFHYLFNHEAARRPLPYPERMIDTCLSLADGGGTLPLGQTVSFAEVDWVYCLTRARRQSPHRYAEVTAALDAFAGRYVAWLQERVRSVPTPFADLHGLFGCLCALAELQSALPGRLRSPRPIRLVLDRRPFI